MLRKLIGSLVAAGSGWCAGFVIAVCFMLATHRNSPPDSGDWLMFPVVFGLLSATFVLTVWAVALVPLYFVVPAGSVLWRWPVSTVCGAIAGGAIMFIYTRVYYPQANDSFPYIVYAAVIGAVTCLVGSLTRERFHDHTNA